MRIAVIGSGIAGLGAAWLLSRQHEVTLYEKNAYLGGHSNTVDVKFPDRTFPVDTGFIVYNERNYPNLVGLFTELEIEVRKTVMSFAASLDDGAFEFAGTNLNTVFGQRSNLLKPSYLAMLWDIMRFNAKAGALLENPRNLTLGKYLDELGMGEWFRTRYLLPMAGAIWSCPLEVMMAYPAESFVRFFENHGLLTVNDQPEWYTVAGGSREYVKKIIRPFSERIRLNTPVACVTRQQGGARVEDVRGGVQQYDHVVLAVHGDEALPLLKDASEAEKSILSTFRTAPNRAVLHMDKTLMPRRKRVWSSWNYLARSGQENAPEISVTYWMNRLQHIPEEHPVFVTLNPLKEPQNGSVFYETTYHHPIFDQAAIEAQQKLKSLQGERNTWFCGAWQRYGFHEDGLLSAVQVASRFAVHAPWQ